jgi:hypothetical protein
MTKGFCVHNNNLVRNTFSFTALLYIYIYIYSRVLYTIDCLPFSPLRTYHTMLGYGGENPLLTPVQQSREPHNITVPLSSPAAVAVVINIYRRLLKHFQEIVTMNFDPCSTTKNFGIFIFYFSSLFEQLNGMTSHVNLPHTGFHSKLYESPNQLFLTKFYYMST